MKSTFITYCLCLLLISGCMTTTTTTRVKRADAGKRGVDVELHQDGTIKLYGNAIDKKTLVKRLIKEESAHKGRAIVLQAKGDIHRRDLIQLRQYLVANRIPNVVIVTPVIAYSYKENTQDIALPKSVPPPSLPAHRLPPRGTHK